MPLFLLHCCFTSTEARWLIRDGDRVGRGRQSEGSTAETVWKGMTCHQMFWCLHDGWPKETGETVDRRVNNGSVKAVSPRHCPATCALHNCCFNCCAWTESQRQSLLHCCWRTTWTSRSERRPTFAAQLHLLTHDLFWANLKVQLHPLL